MRIIKIQTPSNEKININLSGDEIELRELLSVLIGLNPSDIKGLKDKYGNYYTLSYAVGEKSFNSDLSDIFYLVCVGIKDKSTTPVSNLETEQSLEKNDVLYNNLTDVNCNHTKKRKKSLGLNNEINMKKKSLEEENERFFLIVNELTEKNFLDEHWGSKLKNLIIEDNEQITLLFRNYIKNIFDFKAFLSNLIRILNLNCLNSDKNRPNSPTNFTFSLIEYIEKLYPQYFNDLNDIFLLKSNVDNEFIIGAFEVFQSDFDFENFEDSLRRFLNRLKKPLQINHHNSHNILPLTNKNNKNSNRNNSNINNLNLKPQIIQSLRLNNNQIHIQQSGEEETKKLNDSKKISESMSFTNKSPKKAINENTLKIIVKNLHRDQRAIFNYSLVKNFNEIELFAQYYDTVMDENLLVRSVKIYCHKFLNDFILKEFKDNECQTIKNLLKNRDKNLLKLFTYLSDHKDLKKLIDDIRKLLIKLVEIKTSSESEPGSDFSLDKKQVDVQNETVNDENTNVQIKNFLEMIKKVTFLSEEEKIDIIKKYKKKEPPAMTILNQYLKGRNISILKSNLTNLLRNSSVSPNDSSRISPERIKKPQDDLIIKGKSKTKIELQHQSSNNNSNNTHLILRNSSSTIMFNRELMPAGLNEFEKVLNELVEQGEISRHQAKFVIQRFVNSDQFILSTWEAFGFNKNIEEFIESIRISSGNLAKRSTNSVRGKTPAQLARKKKRNH